jgi:hypothetical protein
MHNVVRRGAAFTGDGLIGDCGRSWPFKDGVEVSHAIQTVECGWASKLVGIGYVSDVFKKTCGILNYWYYSSLFAFLLWSRLLRF